MACFVADFNNDGKIDIVDMQTIASRYGFGYGTSLYAPRYDFMPWQYDTGSTPDGDIDIKEVQLVFGRFGAKCLTTRYAHSLLVVTVPPYFGGNVVVDGYAVSTIPFARRDFGFIGAHSIGWEFCAEGGTFGTYTPRWNNYKSATWSSPITLASSGVYETCSQVQVLWSGSWAYWQNPEYPPIPFETRPHPDDGTLETAFGQCYTLKPADPTIDPVNNPYCVSTPSADF